MTIDTSIKGHVAFIAAGAAGIGLACAERFAADGARVAIVDRDVAGAERAAAAIAKAGGEAMALGGECTELADMEKAVAAVTGKWGRLDILANCPGGFRQAQGLETSVEEWRASIDWNLTSIFVVLKAVVPAMRARKYGRIVNIASLAGRSAGLQSSISYSAAKAGVIGLSRRVAVEVAGDGITCNALAPGTTHSPRVDAMPAERAVAMAKATPVGRLGDADEIADCVAYLCRPAAAFVTGAVLDINGGRWTG